MTQSTAQDAGLDHKSRLSIFGAAELSESELLSVVLGNRVSQAASILEAMGGFSVLPKMTANEFGEIPHAGKVTALKLVAIGELSRRLGQVGFAWMKPLRQPSDVAGFVQAKLRDSQRECFVAIGLDSRQRVRLFQTIAIGSLAQVDVHPRELFRPCVREGIHSVILAHNHPSGDPQPSEADIELTHRMADVGKMVGIPVLDHLVVTDDDYCSMAELGLISKP